MEIKELITLKTIIEHGTFSKAAVVLNYTQPTVTNHIKALENFLGFPIFVRGWDAKLTEQGKLLCGQLDKFLEHWEYFCSFANDIGAEETGTLRIGVLELYANETINDVLAWMEQHKPHLNTEFLLGNTQAVYKWLIEKRVDIAFSTEDATFASTVSFSKIQEEMIGFVLPKKHPLLESPNIHYEDILKYPLFIGDTTCITNKYFMRALNENGVLEHKKALHICSNQLLIPNLLVGNRIGILPKFLSRKKNLQFISLSDFSLSFNYGIITRKNSKDYLSTTIQNIIKLFITKN